MQEVHQNLSAYFSRAHTGIDRPKFGSVPVPAEILTWTGIPFSVLERFVISFPAEI